MITEETYTVCRRKEMLVEMKDFDNFNDAYEYYKKDKKEYISGKILHSYKTTEEFFSFNNKDNNK
jgi:hypothetical protein